MNFFFFVTVVALYHIYSNNNHCQNDNVGNKNKYIFIIVKSNKTYAYIKTVIIATVKMIILATKINYIY